jgi:HSP20 family protein
MDVAARIRDAAWTPGVACGTPEPGRAGRGEESTEMPTERPDTWMWQRTWELLDRAERLNRHFFVRLRSREPCPVWEPPIDVYETPDAIWVMAALPGVEPRGVRVSLGEGALVLEGERSTPARCLHAAVRRLEIPRGRFERRLELPPGSYALAVSELADGCLLVGLTKL